jgi:predicted ester cyclase
LGVNAPVGSVAIGGGSSRVGGRRGQIHGTQEAKQFISLYKRAFPDMNATVVAEGDKVVTRVSIRGTHQGATEEFGPPTGRQIEGDLITISRIEGGKIFEDWDAYDNLTTLQQLRLAPEQK